MASEYFSESGALRVIIRRECRSNWSRRAPGYFTLIGDKAAPAARDSSEVVILTPETVVAVDV